MAKKTPQDIAKETARGAQTPEAVLVALRQITENVTDCIRVTEQERTKRAEITAARDVAIERLRIQRDVLLDAMKQSFRERAIVLEAHLRTLDHGIATGNLEVVRSALGATVEVVRTCPWQSASELHRVLGSKDYRLDLK